MGKLALAVLHAIYELEYIQCSHLYWATDQALFKEAALFLCLQNQCQPVTLVILSAKKLSPGLCSDIHSRIGMQIGF